MPLWTVLAAAGAVWKAPWCSRVLGSLPVMQKAYAALMFAMGLSIAPGDWKRAATNTGVLATNAVLCFGGMPLLAVGLARALGYPPGAAAGLVLLGCVSGGQASNLFTLIAGGDVALSVVCTLSTSVLGVVATPVLVRALLGCSVDADPAGVLRSIASLVLLPLLAGSALSRAIPETVRRASPFLPTLGMLATLVLVAGGSATTTAPVLAAATTTTASPWGRLASCLVPSCLLAVTGAAAALGACSVPGIGGGGGGPTRRTLVVETLSKSPTLAYLLALRHFGDDPSVARIPGAAMVTLAVVGALVASAWSVLGGNSGGGGEGTPAAAAAPPGRNCTRSSGTITD